MTIQNSKIFVFSSRIGEKFVRKSRRAEGKNLRAVAGGAKRLRIVNFYVQRTRFYQIFAPCAQFFPPLFY